MKQLCGRPGLKGRSPDREDTAKRVALVTGGARRLGAGICRHLAKQGYRVVVNYRRSIVPAKALVRAIEHKGGEAISIRGDVTRLADVNRMVGRLPLVNALPASRYSGERKDRYSGRAADWLHPA